MSLGLSSERLDRSEREKEAPISKPPVERAQHVTRSVFVDRGQVSGTHVPPRLASCATLLHPDCPRQRCQL